MTPTMLKRILTFCLDMPSLPNFAIDLGVHSIVKCVRRARMCVRLDVCAYRSESIASESVGVNSL